MRSALFFCLILVLIGCATPKTKHLSNSTSLNHLPNNTKLTVPFVGQKDFYCGPATLSMALKAKGKDVHQDEIARQIFTPEKKGTFQFDMTSFARYEGFIVYTIEPSIEALLSEIAAGHPVIVLQNLGLSWFARWHYSLVIGYDLNKKRLILHSGNKANYEMPLTTFERTWSRSNHWGFILLSENELPAEQKPEKLTDAVIESDLRGQHGKAKKLYKLITEKWPEQHLAWFALGNRHYSDGDTELAIAAFNKASQLDKQDSYFNNLAYTMAEYGCIDYAQSVIECGLQLTPNSAILRKTQQEVTHFTPKKHTCPNYICEQID